ncbi:MAG: DUF5668 domain-containing protein, partial [Acidobacteriales bacterium]|nr:DUF5668 domain-containing protein [Terriglobales bacterium]
MRIQRRTNPLWGLVIVALSAVLVARALGYIPAGVFDLILRAWPALLVLAGLSFLLRNRLPLGGGIALIISGVIVVGLATAAYSGRAAQQRNDYRQTIDQPLSGVTLLRLRVEGLTTGVEFLPSLSNIPSVTGEFAGSAESRLEVNYEQAADNSATLTLREVQPGGFPMLESVGRGTLRVELPPDLPVDLDFTGREGDVILNLAGLELERLNVFVTRGDVVITLPEYQPVLSDEGGSNGTMTTRDGDLAIFIPSQVAARLELNREGSGIEPQYDANIYNYLVGDVLEARVIEGADVVVRYTLT